MKVDAEPLGDDAVEVEPTPAHEFLESLTDIARTQVDADQLGDDALEVEPTPAHDPVLLTIRAGFNHLRQFRQLIRRKTRLGTLRPVVDEALQTRPVASD